MDYISLGNQVEKIVRDQGKVLREAFYTRDQTSLAVTGKNDAVDVVTRLDKEGERALFEKLTALLPESGFWGEEWEELRDRDKEWVWLVDPVDGTKYFANQIPLFSISVALLRDNKVELGVIYDPIADQLYVAGTSTATCNGKEIRVSNKSSLREAIIAVDFSPHRDGWEQNGGEILDLVRKLEETVYRCRMLGSGALTLAYVARGGYDAEVHLTPKDGIIKDEDTLCGLALIEKSGGVIRTRETESGVGVIVAGSEEIVDQIVELLLE